MAETEHVFCELGTEVFYQVQLNLSLPKPCLLK